MAEKDVKSKETSIITNQPFSIFVLRCVVVYCGDEWLVAWFSVLCNTVTMWYSIW